MKTSKIKIDYDDLENVSDEELMAKHSRFYDLIKKKLGKDEQFLMYLLEIEKELNLRESGGRR